MPQLGRSPLLIIVVLFLFLFILLPLLNRRSSSSVTDADRALRTQQALARVMSAEKAYLAQHGRYAGHVADLIPLSPKIGLDLADGVVAIQLDSSGDKTYLVQVASSVLSYNRTVVNGKKVAGNCLQLKSAGSHYCTRKTSQIAKSLPAQ
jgi:hypothetical protein